MSTNRRMMDGMLDALTHEQTAALRELLDTNKLSNLFREVSRVADALDRLVAKQEEDPLERPELLPPRRPNEPVRWGQAPLPPEETP